MIEGLINKCYDASNTINPTTFIVRKRLCNHYRISLCIVSCSTLIWRCEKVETTIYKTYTSDNKRCKCSSMCSNGFN